MIGRNNINIRNLKQNQLKYIVFYTINNYVILTNNYETKQ